MVTDPSGCWRVSNRAAMVRGSATPDALRVWTNSGLSPGLGRQRMLARGPWFTLPGGDRLSPKAGSVRDVAAGQDRAVEDLVSMEVRDGHFGRRHEKQVVGLSAIGVLFELGQLSGPDHHLAPDDERGLDLDVAVLPSVQVEHEVDQRAYERRSHAHKHGEARTGELRAAGEVQDPELLANLPMRLAAPRGRQ